MRNEREPCTLNLQKMLSLSHDKQQMMLDF